jgi:signal peptidase I
MLRLLKIRGHSLYPDFQDGDYVLIAKTSFPFGKIRAGDVIVFHQPGFSFMIKRVQDVIDDGRAFMVRGTQVYSTDSRNFGAVPKERVQGKVIWHIRQKPA